MKSMVLALVLVSAQSFAASQTTMTLRRVNLNPEKMLHYDLVYDAKTCQINMATPFDIYYTDIATGRRLAQFSDSSREYFGPRVERTKLFPNRVALQFKALDEINRGANLGAEIWVNLKKNGDRCVALAGVSYGTSKYVLEHVDLKMTKTFGIPTGVDWVLLTGRSPSGPVKDCVVGSCR